MIQADTFLISQNNDILYFEKHLPNQQMMILEFSDA